MALDKLDKRILQALQRDGSITNLELAEQIGLSPSPCARRVKQLEEAGIINKQVTLLNASKLDLK
ncbi:MAG: winged helix-turn-helix transcriptional regulator, partial [Proteobacteria bacterium]|nr:winged helix-turn-helix transcriptional regulator [Pseudomonadota bacterium]